MRCSTDYTTEKSENYLWSVNFCAGKVSFYHKNLHCRVYSLISQLRYSRGVVLTSKNPIEEVSSANHCTAAASSLQLMDSTSPVKSQCIHFYTTNTYHVSFNKYSVKYSLHYISSSCFFFFFFEKKIEGTCKSA